MSDDSHAGTDDYAGSWGKCSECEQATEFCCPYCGVHVCEDCTCPCVIDEDDGVDDIDESMDGDFDTGMTSAGFGTDEDYGYYGDDCE